MPSPIPDVIVKRTLNGLYGAMSAKVEAMPEGAKKEKLRAVVMGFVPAFKVALETGDVRKLQELKKMADELDG